MKIKVATKVEALEIFESTNRVVEDRLDRSGLVWEKKGSRSFEDEEAEGRRSNLDESLDRDNSRFDDLEDKKCPFKEVSSFFDMLFWAVVD